MSNIPEEVRQIQELIKKHQGWRSQTLNLIASENTLSLTVRAAIENDWLGRYADFTGRDLDARRYQGTRYIIEIEKIVERMAKRVFRAEYIEFRPIAGHIAGVAVIMALCKAGDVVLELGGNSGGHREAAKVAKPSLMNLEVHFLPFDGEQYNIDVEAAATMIQEKRPRMVVLGSSNFLFPHPVREIKQALEIVNPEAILVYDASHVLGLLAGGCFQEPLLEGADIVFGSTHKTFPGPQGGIIFTNRDDLIDSISEAVYPGLVTNHHAFRIPALGIALAEMEAFGAEYANQIIANAQALGAALKVEGIPCVSVGGVYSCSHTLLARVAEFGKGAEIALRLEYADIICTALSLPEVQGGEGLRLGVQELTHRGLKESDMVPVAKLVADVIRARRPMSDIATDVHAFTERIEPVQFSW